VKLLHTEEQRTYTFNDGKVFTFFNVVEVDVTEHRHKIHHKDGWSWIFLNGIRCLDLKVKELTF
jgi:hypothetical protein